MLMQIHARVQAVRPCRGRRTVNSEPSPGALVTLMDAAGDFQHAAHQRKAEAVAIPAVGGIALIKLVKDVRERRFVHAAARVAHRHDHVAAILHLPQ